MKKLKLSTTGWFGIFAILLVIIGCDDYHEDNYPRLIRARITNDQHNVVSTTFNKRIYTNSDGFTIWVEDNIAYIDRTEGSGTSIISFILEEPVEFGDNVFIEYSSAEGNAEDENGYRLRTFRKTEVINSIEENDLSVVLPSIPPDMKEYRVWLVLKTDENSSEWASDYATAQVNTLLTTLPTKTPFDLIVYITDDNEWRPDMAFDSGYYASLVGLQDDYIQYEVVSWVRSNSLLNTNMGHIINLNAGEANNTFDNAYLLAVDGNDYLEGDIENSSYLWYKFYGELGYNYTISLYDNITNSYDYSGVVEAVLMDRYEIEFEDVQPVLSGYPVNLSGNDEYVYIKVRTSVRGGKEGNFQIQVIKN